MSALALVLARSVVVLTGGYRDKHVAYFSCFKRPEKVVVIANGIDVARYRRAAPRPPAHMVRIGMAARFTDTKRQDLLVSALALLVRHQPEVNWRLSLAGDGVCHAQVKALVSRLGLGNHVELMGNLDQADLVSWFQSLDFYAHASEGEALSTAMLQAMSMELPIVASAVPGISNLLMQGERQFGLLAKENTPEAFADVIRLLQSNPDLQTRFMADARDLVIRLYNNETMFESYNNLVQGSRN
ncbi:MAG: glycosyltransferase family 4 protein [Polaromonas sp.]|nr:glycosyltransferase family 4 protein [Polaromonas sp.]